MVAFFNSGKLKVCSYNCKNVKTSIDEIHELCEVSDIIFLQETWLMEMDISSFANISKNHYAKGITSIDSSAYIVAGRPHGGLANLWWKSMGRYCSIVTYPDEKRLMSIEVQNSTNKLLFINCYLP